MCTEKSKCPTLGPASPVKTPWYPLVPHGSGILGQTVDRCITTLSITLILSSIHNYKFMRILLYLFFSLPSLSSAPPLTLENILNVVKNVRSWRTLDQHIYYFTTELDAIRRRHVSDEACLKAVIEGFLSGRGRYQPSWRALIWCLYKADEIPLAEHIISFTEPVQGIKFCY
jgi:hypothetical protein